MKRKEKNIIDKTIADKLRLFLEDYFGTLKRASYRLGYTYNHMVECFNQKNNKYVSLKLYNTIIDRLNEGYMVDNFLVKPTPTIEKTYFYKKD